MSIDTAVARVGEILAMQQALLNPASAVAQQQPAAVTPASTSSPAAAGVGGQSFATQLASASAAATPGAAPGAAPGGAPGATINDPTLGPTTNPIPGATGGRLDQGMDGTSQTFLAPFNGKVVYSQGSRSPLHAQIRTTESSETSRSAAPIRPRPASRSPRSSPIRPRWSSSSTPGCRASAHQPRRRLRTPAQPDPSEAPALRKCAVPGKHGRMALPMQTIAGRYELLDVLGRGGMGVVYRSRDQLLERIVAVKVLPAEFAEDPVLVERFEREARAAARLNHPNIVAVFDTGRDSTVRYIVMECVPGQSLAQLLNERGRLPVPEAVAIAAQVADALGAAQAAGIVHRDIKPGNVMVEPSGHVQVLDFGIARLASDAALTQTASILGSAPYMAPEISLGRTADARSDIYSLGCVLYEMLTDRPPFRGEVAAAVINQHVNATPTAPSELNPAVPVALDALVLRMLAKDPALRPQSGAETAAALRAIARDQATAATVAAVPAAAAVAAPAQEWSEEPAERRGTWPIVPVVLAIAAAVTVGVVIAIAASSGSSGPHTTSSSAHSSNTTSSHTSSSTPTSTSSHTSSKPSTTTTTVTTTSTPTSSSTSSPSSTSSTPSTKTSTP